MGMSNDYGAGESLLRCAVKLEARYRNALSMDDVVGILATPSQHAEGPIAQSYNIKAKPECQLRSYMEGLLTSLYISSSSELLLSWS